MSDAKHTIIGRFGGPASVARICGVTPGAVSQWVIIPAKHWPTLIREAEKEGIELTLSELYGPLEKAHA